MQDEPESHWQVKGRECACATGSTPGHDRAGESVPQRGAPGLPRATEQRATARRGRRMRPGEATWPARLPQARRPLRSPPSLPSKGAPCAVRTASHGRVRLQRSRSIPCPEMPRSHVVRQDFQLQSVRFVRNPLRTLKGLMRITLGIQKLSVTGVLLFKGNLIFLKIFLGYHRDLNLWKNLNF